MSRSPLPSSSASVRAWFFASNSPTLNLSRHIVLVGDCAFPTSERPAASHVVYNFPKFADGGKGLSYLTNDWSFSNTFSMQNGLPYSATISSGKNSTNALTSGTWNGVDESGVFYIPVPGLGLNSYQARRAVVDDIRLQNGLAFAEKYQL